MLLGKKNKNALSELDLKYSNITSEQPVESGAILISDSNLYYTFSIIIIYILHSELQLHSCLLERFVLPIVFYFFFPKYFI